MQARMNHPAFDVPGAMDALQALGNATQSGGVPATTIDLLHLRASEIDGCGVCLVMRAPKLHQEGEPDERLFAVAGWRDPPTSPTPSAPRWR